MNLSLLRNPQICEKVSRVVPSPLRIQVKMVWFLVFFVSLCFGQNNSPSEPIKFRGAYLGQSLSDYVDCSAHKAKSLKDGYKVHGKVCEGKVGVVARLKMHTRVMGTLFSDKDAAFEGEEFFFDASKVTRIKIYIPDENEWGKVRYDLIQKLGEPASEIPTVYQNAFGARWEYSQGFWVHGDTVAFAGIKTNNFTTRSRPATEGIELTITDATRAKLPETRASTLD